MERTTGGRTRRAHRGTAGKFLLLYTAMWIVCALAVYALYRIHEKSFLYIYDGVFQHMPAFEYVQQYVRALLRGNPQGLGFFNLTLGQGADVITTLNSYDFTDPVSWLAALLPLNAVNGYTASIFIKLYLVGLSFGVYCRETGRRNALNIALGALAYAFSGATLMTVTRHPNYINWAYYFALIMAGGERYWRKGKKGLLILAVFLNLLTSYYTFFMNAVMFAVYTVLRAACRWSEERTVARAKEELWMCVKTAGVCFVGALVSMVTLLPTLYAYSVNARFNVVSGYQESAWHYPVTYYPRVFISMFAAYMSPSYYTHLGLNALIYPAFVLLFTQKKRRPMKAGLIACAAALALPIAGQFLNGMGYVCNRWSYAVAFAGSAALVELLPRMRRLTRAQAVAIVVMTVVYEALCVVAPKNDALSITWGAMALMAIVAAAVLLAGRLNRRHGAALLAGVVLLGALYQTVFTYADFAGAYTHDFVPEDKVEFALRGHSSAAAAGLDEGFSRVDEQDVWTNTDGINGTYGTEWWWSLLPYWMSDYHHAFELNTMHQNCNFRGLDGRTEVLETASVKYYTAPAAETACVPYGYERIDDGAGAFAVYENQYALPVGYAYKGYMLHADYDALSAVERQMAQLQCAVVDSPVEGFEAVTPDTRTIPLAYEIVETGDVELVEGGLHVTADDGWLRLRADVPEDCELYLVLDGAKIPDDGHDGTIMTIDVAREADGVSLRKTGWLTQITYKWPVVRDALTYNLGHDMPGVNDVVVTFSRDMWLECDSIDLVAVPMQPYARQAEALRAASMTNAQVGGDRISGDIALDAPGILQISVPYSAGWKAWVDGARAKVLRSDDMYMAIPLSAGAHTIEMRYETPYLKAGAALSVLTLAGLFAWHFIRKKFER